MTIVIAYHDKCMDGIAAAWAVWKRAREIGYKGVVKLVPMEYNQPSYDSLLGEINMAVGDSFHPTTLYVVDFSLPMRYLTDIAKGLQTKTIIYDHHKTAFENYQDYWTSAVTYSEDSELMQVRGKLAMPNTEFVLDKRVCGAVLTWDQLHRNDYDSVPPLLLRHINDRDLWKFYHPETKAVHQYLLSQLENKSGREAVELFDVIVDKFENSSLRDKIVRQGLELLEAWQQQVIAYADTAAYLTLAGEPLLTACEVKGKYASDVGNVLAKRSNNGIGCTYFTNIDAGVIKYSLRSVGDVDVSAIAKKFGGGGHKNAAGFELPVAEE